MTDQPHKGPGRPKKREASKSTGKQETKHSSTTRSIKNTVLNDAEDLSTSNVRQRQSRSATSRTHSAEAREDDEYHPPGDELINEGDEETETDFEIGALAWGILSVGGLGTGGAAVFGAETAS